MGGLGRRDISCALHDLGQRQHDRAIIGAVQAGGPDRSTRGITVPTGQQRTRQHLMILPQMRMPRRGQTPRAPGKAYGAIRLAKGQRNTGQAMQGVRIIGPEPRMVAKQVRAPAMSPARSAACPVRAGLPDP